VIVPIINRNPIVILSTLLLFVLVSSANAADWTVVKTFGRTWVQSAGVQKISLSRGARLGANATIVTGSDGKVVLARGDESIVVAPNTMIRLQNGQKSGQRTIIRQDGGTATYQVHKRSSPHFTVQTPTLAAVVKGTKFKIVENRFVSKVWVSEGLVQVSVRSTGDSVDIKPGQSAILERGATLNLRIVGPGVKEPIVKAGIVDGPEAIRATRSAIAGISSDVNASLSRATASAKSAVTDTASSTTSAVQDTASTARSAVEGTVSGVASSVGGGLGGLR
jgi:hypothetical protein